MINSARQQPHSLHFHPTKHNTDFKTDWHERLVIEQLKIWVLLVELGVLQQVLLELWRHWRTKVCVGGTIYVLRSAQQHLKSQVRSLSQANKLSSYSSAIISPRLKGWPHKSVWGVVKDCHVLKLLGSQLEHIFLYYCYLSVTSFKKEGWFGVLR